ncbi:hemolysin family protein [Silvibacterium acidisoli]|uniref:hemolysin family protein n=1 Tax=Acidobacteriaceae bacterium ZG23-2 TaxID=2883246 RepID=UPI00406CBDB0
MTVLSAILITILLVIFTLASYVERLYSEMGKFLAREFQENIDAWEQHVEPRMKLGSEHIRLSASILVLFSLSSLTLLFGELLFDRASLHDRPTAPEIAQVVLGVLLVILIFNQFLPFVFFTRTRGIWIVRLRKPLRVLFYLTMPITFFLGFLLSIAALAESAPHNEEETSQEAVDALLEAGEEEGILEESDRELVRSAVEFGDKVVREVMTPRPEMFAVPDTTTIGEFISRIEEQPYSRVPVYRGGVDHIIGIVFAHDLLHISDEDAKTQTVGSIRRPATVIPETKKVNELLREMQREKQHMRIVIDEYGGVAGLVTIEDLLEEIVGNITDEHEEDSESILHEQDGSWIAPGNLELSRVEELLGGEVDLPEDYEATTIGGLISEEAGRIPQAGEVVVLYGVRVEILASTDRRIERVRLARAEKNEGE